MRQPGWRFPLALFLLPLGLQAAELPLARVQALQPPVWLERAGTKTPLSPGLNLQAGDRFITGPDARLQIWMNDESLVKLGEDAQLEMRALELKPQAKEATGLLRSVLKVARGAFRYTTLAVGKLRPREVQVQIGTRITAGIRGTDIWGKSEDAQNLLVLIEGKIEVTPAGEAARMMETHRTSFTMPKGQPPLPVSPTSEEELAEYVPQTELVRAQAALTPGGKFKLGLSSHGDRAAADKDLKALALQGYAAAIESSDIQGKAWHRVVLPGFASYADAKTYVALMKQRLGYTSPWVISPGAAKPATEPHAEI